MLTTRNRYKWEECTLGALNQGKCIIFSKKSLVSTFDNSLTVKSKLHSRSLNDLTENQQHRKERRRAQSMTCVIQHLRHAKLQQFLEIPNWSKTHIVNEAGRRIQSLLMLNAWRRRRQESECVRTMAAALTNEVNSLQMQVYVLRNLIENEKSRTAAAVKEIQKNLLKIEGYEQERLLMLKEKGNLECEIKNLLDSLKTLENEYTNQKNDLTTAQIEAETWDLRFKKERKKVKALREEIMVLENNARSRDKEIASQKQCIEELNDLQYILKKELDNANAEIILTKEKIEQSESLKLLQDKFLNKKNEEIGKLKAEIAQLEEKLQQEDERNGELRKLISDKTKELIIMNEKLGEITKSQKFWGHRVVKMASLCTRIPVACFYTIATLLLPQPTCRSF